MTRTADLRIMRIQSPNLSRYERFLLYLILEGLESSLVLSIVYLI